MRAARGREGKRLTQDSLLAMLRQIADGIAAHFGPNCEVVIHDVRQREPENSIVYIVNGHVSGRKAGEGGSHAVTELRTNPRPEDRFGYLTSVRGKILKSTTLYIRDEEGAVAALLSVNYDISALTVAENAIRALISPTEDSQPEQIVNIMDALDELIEQSVALVGKPAAMMNKEDKVRAIRFLNEKGAFLVTRSGDKIARYFGISKYTLYSYINETESEPEED